MYNELNSIGIVYARNELWRFKWLFLF